MCCSRFYLQVEIEDLGVGRVVSCVSHSALEVLLLVQVIAAHLNTLSLFVI